MRSEEKKRKAERKRGAAGGRRAAKSSFNSLRFVFLFSFILTALATGGCQPNQEILNSSSARPTRQEAVEPSQDTFEKALREVRTADFTYIYVLRRGDGGVFDSEDKKYVKDFSPPETNRFVLTDNGRVVILGSNFLFPPESLEALRLRFTIEDYSKPPIETNVNN